jgi:hypothetical protein
MERYVVAVRREARDRVPEDWQARVQATEGVAVEGAANPQRLQIRATGAAIAEVRRVFGEFLHIEPLISHRTS